jgi:DtxR family Mn-dependent transcriptional regulator
MAASEDSPSAETGPADPVLTPSQENYLSAIHRLAPAGPVQVKDLAAAVGVRRPSVSRAVGELARLGLVSHHAYGRIELTESGLRVGRQLARRQSCLARLLVEVLGMDPTAADREVHRLEHALSSEAWMRRLRNRLHAGRRRGASESPGGGEASVHAGRPGFGNGFG